MRKLILTLATCILSASALAGQVSISSLLQEMTDRDRICRLPEHNHVSRQASSYDRRTVAKDQPGWFANSDRSWFIRTEQNDGRTEFVMMDAEGPGAIVRFWMTFAGNGAGEGTMRIYIDGCSKPVIEGRALDIISGHVLAPAPLSDSVSPLTEYIKRGHDLYLPIPYAKSCKITYQSDNVNAERPGATGKTDERVYYNIEYRTYGPDTAVESFSMEALSKAHSDMARACSMLSSPADNVSGIGSRKDISCTLKAGEAKSFRIKGSRAVREICMKILAGNQSVALRGLMMRLEFDGETTADVPVGDFFGTGYRIHQAHSWYNDVDKHGMMRAWWVMPFEKECILTLHNETAEIIVISDASVATGKWKWSDDCMHFGASWHQYSGLLCGRDDNSAEVAFASLKGKGIYVGDGVCLYNPAKKWWGEGDEKIYIDGESFPSHIGTGTEDYFGYAWCKGNVFTGHPFIAQPCGDGSEQPGLVVNSRYRSLDAIPFETSLQFDMEVWHQVNDTVMDYAPVSYWYMMPGGQSEIKADIKGATTETR